MPPTITAWATSALASRLARDNTHGRCLTSLPSADRSPCWSQYQRWCTGECTAICRYPFNSDRCLASRSQWLLVCDFKHFLMQSPRKGIARKVSSSPAFAVESSLSNLSYTNFKKYLSRNFKHSDFDNYRKHFKSYVFKNLRILVLQTFLLNSSNQWKPKQTIIFFKYPTLNYVIQKWLQSLLALLI